MPVSCAVWAHGVTLETVCAEATTNKGGGNEGKADRLGGAAGHAKFQ